jgi:hypothetical protein
MPQRTRFSSRKQDFLMRLDGMLGKKSSAKRSMMGCFLHILTQQQNDKFKHWRTAQFLGQE